MFYIQIPNSNAGLSLTRSSKLQLDLHITDNATLCYSAFAVWTELGLDPPMQILSGHVICPYVMQHNGLLPELEPVVEKLLRSLSDAEELYYSVDPAKIGIPQPGREAAPLPLSPADVGIVKQLLDSQDPERLDSVVRISRAMHPAVLAVYRWKRLQLAPGRSEELRYLKALPVSWSDLWSVYKLTAQGLFDDSVDVSDVVYGMYEHAARIAEKRAKGHEAFVRLCLLTDGELAAAAWEWFDWLLENDTDRTIDAIRKLPPGDQHRLCGLPDLRKISPAEARQLCSSDR